MGSGGRYQTCICLSGGGQMTLADCGATSLTALKAQRLNPGTINAVAVTHLHGDYFGGPPFLILDGQFTGRKARHDLGVLAGLIGLLRGAAGAAAAADRRDATGPLARLPPVNYRALRADLDKVMDPAL